MPEGWVGGGRRRRGGASSRGISVGYQQILSQLVEVKGVPIIFEGQTLQEWGFDGRRPKSSSKSSNKQQNQEQHKQHKQQPRGPRGVGPEGGVASSNGISVVFEAFFFWMQTKFVIIGF